jgi:hypothetical protein
MPTVKCVSNSTSAFEAASLGELLRPATNRPMSEFVSRDRLDDLPMHPTTRLRVDYYLQDRLEPYLG